MRKRLMRYVFATCCLLAVAAQCQAGVVTFGSGVNQFNIEFVTIGNPGNAPDTAGSLVLVQREMDFCLIGVNRKWVTVTNLF